MIKKLVIIPSYNEAKNLTNLINNLKRFAPDYDYVIINDCSTDNTEEICLHHNYNVINLPINLGIGGAVQTGYKYAKNKGYDLAIQIDGDGQHDPQNITNLEEYIINNSFDFVIGSRFIKKEGFQSSFLRRIGIRYFSFLIYIFTKKRITDPTSGFRACNRKLILYFAENYPRDYPEPETVVSLARLKYRIKEVPVIMKERVEGNSSISNWKTLYYIFKVSLAICIEFSKIISIKELSLFKTYYDK